MNEIEKLNERIAQLTDLVKSGEETISATKEMLKLAEEERDRLAEQRRESEPKFERVGKDESYWSLQFNNAFYSGVSIHRWREHGDNYLDDINNFEGNNYFKTMQRAEEIADKINLLLKLERLHDTFCPDYVPDWDDFNAFKFSVIYNPAEKKWYQTITGVIGTCTYFPTREIAQKVCDILNAERNEDK